MVKYNYFESLESLSALAAQAVLLACGRSAREEKQGFSSLRRSCDRLLCELEDALFSDFLPPLERDSIAACAHCLSRVMDQAIELSGHTAPTSSAARINEEGKICVRLAEQLKQAIAMLPKLRKPNEMPDCQGFRKLMGEGRTAHASMLKQLHEGTLPRSWAQTIILTGRLRAELSLAFDELVEIMLHNI